MPILGMTKTRRTPGRGLADALFSTTQQRVLGLLFGQPERSYYATELIGLAGGGSGAVQREVARLAQSGLVTVRRVGSQKHYQANPQSPLFKELVAIARKTVGLSGPIGDALKPLSRQIVAAFVYGSVAKKSDTARSDIDLLVVSDRLAYADLYKALEPLGAKLGRDVNPTVLSREDLAARLKGGSAFARRVLEQPKIWVIGSEHDISA